MDILKLIGRKNGLLDKDISNHTNELDKLVLNHRFLVIGGAGSIGQAVVKEIFKRNLLLFMLLTSTRITWSSL